MMAEWTWDSAPDGWSGSVCFGEPGGSVANAGVAADPSRTATSPVRTAALRRALVKMISFGRAFQARCCWCELAVLQEGRASVASTDALLIAY